MNLAANARDAMPRGGHADDRRPRTTTSTEQKRAARSGLTPGAYVLLTVTRHRAGHSRRHPAAHLRAVLHDEGAGEGDRAGPRDRLRDREAERRRGLPGRGEGDVAFTCHPGRASPERGADPDDARRLLALLEVGRDRRGPRARRSSRSRGSRRCIVKIVARVFGVFLLHHLARQHAAQAAAAGCSCAALRLRAAPCSSRVERRDRRERRALSCCLLLVHALHALLDQRVHRDHRGHLLGRHRRSSPAATAFQ